jgi:hypothetical protein
VNLQVSPDSLSLSYFLRVVYESLYDFLRDETSLTSFYVLFSGFVCTTRFAKLINPRGLLANNNCYQVLQTTRTYFYRAAGPALRAI